MFYAVNKKEYFLRIILKLIAIIASLFGMIKDFNGWNSLTYFTYQSNIFISIILFIFMIFDIIYLNSNSEKNYKTDLWYLIKFMATISITVTLLVFAFILAPVMGGYMHAYFTMDGGASFCLHLLVPVIALIDFISYDDDFDSKLIYSFFAVVPAILYVIYVVFMGQVIGYRWGEMMAPYNFLNYGAPVGWFGFDLSTIDMTTVGIGVCYMVIILIIFFIILGAILLAFNKRLHRTRNYY